MTSLKTFKKEIEREFENNNIDKSEVNILFCEALNCSQAQLFSKDEISFWQKRLIKKFAKKRLKGMPIQSIFKKAYFFGNVFFVNSNVLCPRPETELLVEECLKSVKDDCKILDLCTGSGCIAISLKKELLKQQKNCDVFASDISSKALAVAKKNAKKLGADVVFLKSDMFEKFEKNLKKYQKNAKKTDIFDKNEQKNSKKSKKTIPQKFDIIVSNPPYIKTKDISFLDAEVKNYDPIISLDGGIDGLDFYRIIAENASKFLSKNGKIFLEVGIGEVQDVVNLLAQKGFDCFIKKDYNNIERIVVGELLWLKNVTK